MLKAHASHPMDYENSGVGTGWHGWTMFRGPGAKWAPRKRERETTKKRKKKENDYRKEKRKEEKKIEN